MRLVTDANIFISAFLRGGLTRRLWVKYELELFAPRFLIDEYTAYAEELRERAGYSAQESIKMSEELLQRLRFVSFQEFAPYLPAARTLVTDEKDEAYAASALAIGCDLWSHDRHLKQPRIKCWSTKELGQYFGYI